MMDVRTGTDIVFVFEIENWLLRRRLLQGECEGRSGVMLRSVRVLRWSGDDSNLLSTILTSPGEQAVASDCWVLLGERRLRKEPMLRSFCFRSDPIRPLR